MKKIYLILSIVTAAFFCSCSDWLDVKSLTEKDRDELISTQEGFEKMLNGVYISLCDNALYGHELMFGSVEAMAHNLYFKDEDKNPFFKWQYEDITARPIIENIWGKAYNTIANANSILKDIDNRKEVFKEDGYALMKGEALAVRAFVHFDMLRLFAPNVTDNPDAIAIPYVEAYERVRYPHIAAKKVVEKVLADLNAAEALLSGTDPIVKSKKNKQWRDFRFHYYAVTALTARVHMYCNQKEKAAEYALKTLQDTTFYWSNSYSGDPLFKSEVICALNVSNMKTYYDGYFKNERYKLGSDDADYTNCIFENPDDHRKMYGFESSSKGREIISKKYKQEKSDAANQTKRPMVPIIRLGEMVLILAEYNLDVDTRETVKLLRMLRTKRGYLTETISDDATKEELQAIILQEFRKETYLEGQTFFANKRLKLAEISTLGALEDGKAPVKSISAAAYTLPLPDSEKEFGNIPPKAQ